MSHNFPYLKFLLAVYHDRCWLAMLLRLARQRIGCQTAQQVHVKHRMYARRRVQSHFVTPDQSYDRAWQGQPIEFLGRATGVDILQLQRLTTASIYIPS